MISKVEQVSEPQTDIYYEYHYNIVTKYKSEYSAKTEDQIKDISGFILTEHGVYIPTSDILNFTEKKEKIGYMTVQYKVMYYFFLGIPFWKSTYKKITYEYRGKGYETEWQLY